MFGAIRKIPTTCPHCGFVQNEPAALLSTFCRSCGDHYSTTAAPPNPAAIPVTIPAALRAQTRTVDCAGCGLDHTVSAQIHSSRCPTCGTETHLSDVHITSHFARPVDTRGTIHVARTGYLNAPHTRCANARIEGQFSGRIDCAGTLRIRGEGICRARIETRTLIIDRGSDFRFAFPIRADEILIRGHVEADIFCPGTIRVGRYGWLDGDVHTRSLIVDKGGAYEGSVEVATTIIDNYPRAGAIRPPEIKVLPAWQSIFATA